MKDDSQGNAPHDDLSTPDAGPSRVKQTDQLVNLALDAGELFHDKQLRPYVRLSTGQVLRLDQRSARHWLQRTFRAAESSAANPMSVRAALEQLIADALYEGPVEKVHLRVGESTDGSTWIDLGDESFEGIEIAPDGVQVTRPDIRFVRKQHAQPLCRPARDGALEALRAFVNVEDEGGFRLIVAWLLMTLNPSGPFPILVLQGEQGSAKSTTAEVLKRLIDPTVPMIRAVPRSPRDLAIAAEGNWILVFDNISFLNDEISDALCRLSTGGGFGTRTLYEGEDETVFEQCRPIILNGIDGVARRQDLLDRVLVVQLPRIAPAERLSEQQFWSGFEAVRPLILRGLLDAAQVASRNLVDVRLARTPRMADFARWITAAEPALGWAPGSFVALFDDMQAGALAESLDGSPVASVLLDWLATDAEWQWEGTPSHLYELLTDRAMNGDRKPQKWPRSPQALSVHLTRLASALRLVGVEITSTHRGRGADKTRLVKVVTRPNGDAGDGGDAE